MVRKLLNAGTFLVVSVLLVVALGACARSVEEREATEATPVATAVSSGSESAPVAGETVVSAVTSVSQTPGAEAQPTLATGEQPTAEVQPTTAPAAGTSVATQPQPTAVPVATAAPPPAASGQTGEIWHTVQRAETLSSVARRYGTTWQVIAQANGIVNPNQIYVGQKLKIPTSGGASAGSSGGTSGCRVRHTVRPGEWVWQIARNYGVSPYDILAANGLTIQSANTIYAGTVLCIP
jgi:LysM repeat protein